MVVRHTGNTNVLYDVSNVKTLDTDNPNFATWLRSTTSQERLNACAVCFTHSDLLQLLDMKQLAADFISRNDYRRSVFGIADM